MLEPSKYYRLSNGSSLPLYQQIQENIIQLIDDNLLHPDDVLPSERQLSELYGVNRMTVRQAIDGLVQKKLVTRKQGAGTFVAQRRGQLNLTPTVFGFSQRMRQAGMNPSSRLLHRAAIQPNPDVAHVLNLPPDAPVIVLKRLRLVDGEPLMIETSYLSQALFPGLLDADLENESLYHILANEYGMVVTEAEHTLEPAMPDAYEAHHLGVEITMPTMLVRVLAFSRDRIPVEMSKSIVRGDRCRFFFRVNTSTPIMQ